MNDDDARRLLAGIDAPRPLPAGVRDELLATLTTANELVAADVPRPLPDDLRHRLEATLSGRASRPLPRVLRSRVLAATAAAVLALGGLAVVLQPDGDDGTLEAGRRTPTTSGATRTTTTVAGSATGGSAASETPAAPTASGGGSTSFDGTGDATASPGAARSSEQAHALTISVLGDRSTAAGVAFEAYLRTVNAAGGVDGRSLIAVDGTGGVATVNLARTPRSDTVEGVLFETAFVTDDVVRGSVTSLASPLEAQARLAVAHAYPRDAGGRAALYRSAASPWSAVADAFADALRDRGVTIVEVPFSAGAPAYVPGADAAFLALAPDDVSAWITRAPGAARGVWAVASGYDDRLAGRAAELGVRVLSPYRPVGGEEEAALVAALPDHALSTEGIHGWVTAKAIVELLRRNGASTIVAGDLDRLTDWDPGWAPPFETRPRTRARTPEAILLRPEGGRFVAGGDFERA